MNDFAVLQIELMSGKGVDCLPWTTERIIYEIYMKRDS